MTPDPSNGDAQGKVGESAQPPTLSLPKGGGAIHGIGEKFAVNPANGTAAFTVPVFTTPCRSGFYPQLYLSYDSGAGNGPFGLGWKLSLPSITRKTDKGLPQYRDAQESDIFILSDAEDLVPSITQRGSSFQPDVRTETAKNGRTYLVKRYRPRVEGLFARIERWQDLATGDIYWQSVSKDNVTSIFGQSASARIADPEDPARIFRWLLEQSFDDKGNAILYEYKQEDHENVPGSPQEMNRLRNVNRTVNRYLKRIRYGKKSFEEETPSLFQVVFDYGEHDPANPAPEETSTWPCRADPFSDCHACFEVRTYRLCRRVLMFHSFAELGAAPCVVRSTDLSYNENPVCSYLRSITQTGYLWDREKYQTASFPPIEFAYSQPKIDPTIKFVDKDSLENLPIGLDQVRYRWIDLNSEGISGILAEQSEAWFYKRNLGTANFAPAEVIRKVPSLASAGSARQELLDLAGDGQKALVQFSKPLAGYSERGPSGNWGPFTPFASNPNVSWSDPNLKLIDLDGDGFSDILISEDETFTWCLSQAKLGFSDFATVRKPTDEERGPTLVFADPTQSIYLADMTGDGLADLVRIRNGEVCYWANLGYGRFGPKVTMDQSPLFDHPDSFDQKQIRLADIDGSGTTDVIYLSGTSVAFWFNQSGNSWSDRQLISNFPLTDELASVTTVDLFGNGTSCLVWSSPLAENAARPIAYVDLMSGQKPHLLTSITNNMGTQTRLQYAASTQFYLQDRAAGHPWVTRLPFPVQLVQKVVTFDGVANTQLTSVYSYHHGYYDGVEREFRGFGRVDQWDTETLAPVAGTGEFPGGSSGLEQELYVPPVHTRTWFHTGAFFGGGRISRHLAHEYYTGDSAAAVLPDTVLPSGLTGEEEREACRALKGKMLRQEIYADDGSPQVGNPYNVVEKNYSVDMIQPFCGNPHASFKTWPRETSSYHYERNPADPRISHDFTLEVDDFGRVTKSASIAYPRRGASSNSAFAEQLQTLCTYSEFDFINRANGAAYYRVGVPSETRSFEIKGLGKPPANGFYTFDDLQARLPLAAEIPYEAAPSAGKVTEGQAAKGVAPMRTNERIYVGGYEIYREYKSGNTTPSLERQTLHVMDDKRRVVMVETKTIDVSAAPGAIPATVDRYQFDNHLGSGMLELDGQAAIISYEEYYPYGSTAYQAVNTSIEASPRRYRYTGEERDDETGFNYQGARYYAPWLGRWTSCDPVVSSKSLPQALNRYCYANANPIIYSDPAGRQSQMVEALGEPFREAEASLKQGWEQVKQWASEDIEEWKHPLQSLGLTPAPDPSAAKPIPHSPAPAPRELSSFDWRPPSVEEEWRAMEKPAQARVLGGKLTVWESPELQETRQTIRKLNNLVEAGDVTGPY